MVLGAGLGTVVVAQLGSGWAASVVLVAAVAAMVHLLPRIGLAHPPSVALVLVPLLVHHLAPGTFVAGVAVGAAVVVGAGAGAIAAATRWSGRWAAPHPVG
jgi:hypothetical protein